MPTDQIATIGPGAFLVSDRDGTHARAWAVADERVVWVFLAGRAYRIGSANEHSTSPSPAAHRDDDIDLSAPMPATVAAVHVQPGQQVAEGDTLITLEAMKMELPIRAPRAGTVKSVACRAGEIVQVGVRLVELD